ncbi:hypothetical protein SARC_17980, partial [Sphaeroforma arctica JP610]
RTLDLDNTNIGALTGLAVLNLNGDEDDSLLKGMRLISHGMCVQTEAARGGEGREVIVGEFTCSL